MSSSDRELTLSYELFKKACSGLFKKRRKVYSESAVCWMMCSQFLCGNISMFAVMDSLWSGGLNELVGNCKRTRERKISRNTSAYAQARSDIPLEKVLQVSRQVFEHLSPKSLLWNGRPVYALDGTTLSLSAQSALRKKYPGASNQHGQSRNPILLLAVAHDLMTGYALQPESGPMYGEERTGEIKLGLQVMRNLPEQSIVVADRNFGIFSIVYHAKQQGRDVVLRLTESRAKAVQKKGLDDRTDIRVQWRCSKPDVKANPDIPPEAEVEGRLIVHDVVHKEKTTRLYLFTTCFEYSASEISALYQRRWRIETDLRHLKKVVHIDQLRGKSPSIVAKELVMAIVAYNLIRSFMALAAECRNVEPSRISFATALADMRSAIPRLLFAKNERERLEIMQTRVLSLACCVNPIRKRRSYPREVYKKRRDYAVKSSVLPNEKT